MLCTVNYKKSNDVFFSFIFRVRDIERECVCYSVGKSVNVKYVAQKIVKFSFIFASG